MFDDLTMMTSLLSRKSERKPGRPLIEVVGGEEAAAAAAGGGEEGEECGEEEEEEEEGKMVCVRFL